MMILQVAGRGALEAFKHEPGGHRWQRVPPTEKRGRRHTSTVTVAVLPVLPLLEMAIPEQDIEWEAMRGSGSGGQAKQKTSNAVRMTHKQTGLSVRVETTRSQAQNRELAMNLLIARLTEKAAASMSEKEARQRRIMVGSGQRGDKIRTVRLQDDVVTNHLNGRTMSAKKYLRGEIRGLIR